MKLSEHIARALCLAINDDPDAMAYGGLLHLPRSNSGHILASPMSGPLWRFRVNEACGVCRSLGRDPDEEI